jgi:hypothetical protein
MRKPKKIRLPKMPKASASEETLKNYRKKVMDVDKRNHAKMKPYRAWLAEKKRKANLRKSVSAHRAKIGSKSYC